MYSPFDGSILLNRFFDLHFSRIDEKIFYIAFYSYISNQTVPEDNYKEYSIYSQMNNNYVPYPGRYVKYIPIDEKLLTFIDNVLTTSYPTQQIIQNQINVFFTKNQYWSTQRRSIFHNYLQNWGIKKILQIKAYTKCTVHFSTTFYEWRMSSENQNSSIVKLDENQMALQINHFMPQSIEAMQMNFANNDTNCLDIGFFSPNSRTKKTNYTLIKKYICYFTMNNASVLDNLALDYVNSVLKQSFSRKNTVICGDYDKYNKWINMFNPVGIYNTGLIAFYPYPLPIQTISLINHPDDEIERAIRDNAKEVNIVRAVHKHFLITSAYELPNKLKKYVNYIDFPYGGEFYNYEPLNDIDRLEIVKLLLVHGWHLLNSTEKPKESETKATIEILFDHLENTKETRIPLKALYQIYQRFIDSKETMTGLRKYLQDKGYEYKTMDIRNSDKDYLQTLINQSEKRYLRLDIAPSDKQKAFSCKLDPELWNAISPQRKKETEDKNAADFNEYLKELAEKYAPFFIEEEPEKPINDDPLAGFVPPEKFKDEDLQ